jgi:putative membrane protein
VNADDSARMRDLLASHRTLLAWIRTAISFAGLGFVVAKFGRTEAMIHQAGALGIFLVLVGLLLTILGFIQHHITLQREEAPPGAPVPSEWPSVTAMVICALSCLLLAVYLAATAG